MGECQLQGWPTGVYGCLRGVIENMSVVSGGGLMARWGESGSLASLPSLLFLTDGLCYHPDLV